MSRPADQGLQISWPTVLRGAVCALVIAIPAIVAAEVVDAIAELDQESNFIFVFYLLIVIGMIFGGWRAGQLAPEAPLTHGALAAMVAYGLLALGTTLLRLAQGDATNIVGIIFNAFIAASAGILGGMVAGRGPRDPGPVATD